MPESRRPRSFLRKPSERARASGKPDDYDSKVAAEAPSQPKATPAPKKPPAPVKVGPAHYRTILTPYWATARGPEVIAEFANRMRGDLTPDEIRHEIIPMLPAATLGTTGVQVARLRAALERVASRETI